MQIKDRIKELRRVRASELIPNPKNWRTHPSAQQDALRGVLAEVGYADALIARETPDGLMLVDGHLRAETTPDSNVPVLVLDINEAEADLMLATLDPLAAMAGRDEERLTDLLAAVSSENDTVDALLKTLADGYEPLTITDPEPPDEGFDVGDAVDDVEADDYVPTVQRGDIWSLGQHRLMCGDATLEGDVVALMDGLKADCVFTSPPYAVGIDYGEYDDTLENLRVLLPLVAGRWRDEVLDTGGFAVVNFADVISGKAMANSDVVCEYPMALEHWPVFRTAGYTLWSRRAWCKPGAAVGSSRHCIGTNRAASNYEHVWTWKLPGIPLVDEQITGDYTSQSGWFETTHDNKLGVGLRDFGAGMPVSVAMRMIAIHARPSSIVHEPFVGSGTTIIAAERLGRRCYAMEIEPRYCDVSIKRWEDYTGQKAVKV